MGGAGIRVRANSSAATGQSRSVAEDAARRTSCAEQTIVGCAPRTVDRARGTGSRTGSHTVQGLVTPRFDRGGGSPSDVAPQARRPQGVLLPPSPPAPGTVVEGDRPRHEPAGQRVAARSRPPAGRRASAAALVGTPPWRGCTHARRRALDSPLTRRRAAPAAGTASGTRFAAPSGLGPRPGQCVR